MFKLIGADGKEYGPTSAEEVRRWIGEGRVNRQTLVQRGGETQWQPLSDLPEFAQELGAEPVAAPPVMANRYKTEEILARDYRLDIGGWLGRGWELVTNHFWLTVGSSALALVLQIAVEVIPLLGWVATTLFAMVLWGGVDWLFLKLARGQPASFADTFSGFSRALVPLLVLGVITMTLVPIGFLFCLAPGVYLMAIWMLFPALLIMDKGMEFWPAMELSRKVVQRHPWAFVWFVVVIFLVFFAGFLACGVGAFVTLAITNAAIVYAYEDIFNPNGGQALPSVAGSVPAT